MPAALPKVLFATSEAYPLIKTGGLADVSGALPAALHTLGADIKILLPAYPAVRDKCRDAQLFAQLPNPFGTGNVEIWEAQLPESAVPVLIVAHDAYFNREGGPYQTPQGADWPDNALRFGLLSYVAAWLGSQYEGAWQPDIVHCNDWQTGLAPAYLRFWTGRKPPSIMTIHNLAYQGIFPPEDVARLALPAESFKIQGLEFWGNLSFLKSGIVYSDRITTVSPNYAQEIQHEPLGFGMHGLLYERRGVLTGILNGIDDQEWNPATDPHLAHRFDATQLDLKAKNKTALQQALALDVAQDTPLLAIISRVTYQKGSDVCLGVMQELVAEGVQFALLGAGDKALEQAYLSFALAHPGRVSVTIGYDEALSHRMEAGADLFLMPSRYEPCGLNQMYSQRYGTPPIAHATGGLADTIVDATPENLAAGTASGFLFHPMSHAACAAALRTALQVYRDKAQWRRMQATAMARDFSWTQSARAYLDLYISLLP